ncbi:MAG: ABC transporter ATP-binding protein [Desulfobacterales bacterium]|nr:ABC transporter ATP-binding protein [Desulfobacterales bacterium]MDD4072829.1 ABC transporter ATP-binding protein [Desulfobacterales bacterium]MDD4391299.1 ABC transporter ATP-binding protein [Desulfobacterales bacterium]
MLQIENLTCCYGRIMAVKGISLCVKQGELIALIGSNGSGKSTLLSAICGLLPMWTGTINFNGKSMAQMPPPDIVRTGISLVPEGRQIFGPLSVLDNLKLGAYTMYRKGRRKEVETDLHMIMALFPILKERAHQPAGTLSGGEQQMLALGRALMAKPRLLVLDEPSTGLAPLIVDMILQTLVTLRNSGMTILLVEQNARAALAIADRGYVLQTGRIVLKGPAADLLVNDEVKRAYLG